MADNNFAPSSVELTATVKTNGMHEISQLYLWDTDTFTKSQAVTLNLVLNDSPDSKYGPGTFLDNAQELLSASPAYTPTVNDFSELDIFKATRRGDPPVWVKFGLIVREPQMIQPNFVYRLTWTTPAPNPNPLMDNADLYVKLSSVYSICDSLPICFKDLAECQIDIGDWSIDPLPGHFRYGRATDCQSLDIFQIFLAWIKNL